MPETTPQISDLVMVMTTKERRTIIQEMEEERVKFDHHIEVGGIGDRFKFAVY